MTILTTKTSELSSGWQLVGVFILFIFILGATYLTTKIVGGVKLNQIKNSNFQVIETYRITQNKYLQLVKVGTRYLVLGISKDNVNFITELKEDEILNFDQMAKAKVNFSDIMSKLTNRQNNFVSQNKEHNLEHQQHNGGSQDNKNN
ncbi:flagellar biosynthetic protein FliO [Anaerocolumna aminovalerica]|jgi:flagellar protein FliO/FliZ|uniref:flagellar biosynthetic protein FliO n=1 Tax=Anaerocolumna aminovalerica TaxID=1527 RepID=UPI000BE226E8|nr:flagellar biosynthetic protein FliO [Anaerocolumna aminovalerica]